MTRDSRPGGKAKTAIATLSTAIGLVVFAAPAEAHTASFAATCGSVEYNWTSFASSGSGNGGMNAPTWSFKFTPAAGGADTLGSGQAAFSGSAFSLTKALPAVNGTVVASTAWTSAQTRDGHSGSATQTIAVTGCAPSNPPSNPPTTPPTVTPPSNGTAGVLGKKKKKKKKRVKPSPAKGNGAGFTG